MWPPDQKEISIHALRAEGDVFGHDVGLLVQRISIHALRAEGDQYPRYDRGRHTYFYPRPPCGGRLDVELAKEYGILISIHALRAEGDLRTGSS